MTPHMVEHTRDVAFVNPNNMCYIKEVPHVPTNIKNLVSVGQIVEQGMQVLVNQEVCFIKDNCKLIGHMFILYRTDVNTMLFEKGLNAKFDIGLYHKRVGHVKPK